MALKKQPESKFVQVLGLKLHYLDWGTENKPPMVLLHGGLQTAHSWDFVAFALRNRYHVRALDQRGHGDSDWAPDQDYSLEAQMKDMEKFIDTLGMEEKHVVSVPTGIDLSRFRKTAAIRGALGIPATAFVFGIVATLRSWKGHEYLLDAFSTLQGDFHLLIAGDGPQRPVLEKRIAAEEKRSKIHLVGQREDIPEIMSSMDCFVLPSYANEGVPQAIMQAMAAELPVISTRVGAIDEAVIDGETGVLVPPRDPQALAAAMLEMYRLPEMRVEMGRKARLVAEQKFSLEKMLDAMEQVFLSVQ